MVYNMPLTFSKALMKTNCGSVLTSLLSGLKVSENKNEQKLSFSVSSV